MAKKNSSKSVKHYDPQYPFPSELDERGIPIYSLPAEANSVDALVTLNAAEYGGRQYLRFEDGKVYPVVFVPSPNRELAFWMRGNINTQHTHERRQEDREHHLNGDHLKWEDDEIGIDDHPMLATDEQGYSDVETKDLIEHIAEYIEMKHPKNNHYGIVFLLTAQKVAPKIIARYLKVDPDTVYFYQKTNRRIMREYLEKFLED